MLKGPKIKLAVNLHKLNKFFPLNLHLSEGFDYDWIIEREKYNNVAALLKMYDIAEDQLVLEFCFVLLWIEKETFAGYDTGNLPGKFNQMWLELDNLKDYLLHNRVTSITLKGEFKKNQPGAELTLSEDINIDRLCDGIRSVFRDEFHHDKQSRRTKGLGAWQRRKMIRIRNNFMNYFSSIPILDDLSLEDQNHLVDKISELAGIPGSM